MNCNISGIVKAQVEIRGLVGHRVTVTATVLVTSKEVQSGPCMPVGEPLNRIYLYIEQILVTRCRAML